MRTCAKAFNMKIVFLWAALLSFHASTQYAYAGMSEEEVKRFKLAKEYADKGDPKAQLDLGIFHHYGEGTKVNHAEAFIWYLKAAEQGLPKAQHNVGYYCYEGLGVAKNQENAVKWFFKASNQGLAESQAYLGRCYRLGEGVLKDQVEAYAYYNLAGRTNDGARIFRDELESSLSAEDRKAGLNRAKELQKEIDAKIAAKKAGK